MFDVCFCESEPAVLVRMNDNQVQQQTNKKNLQPFVKSSSTQILKYSHASVHEQEAVTNALCF